MNDEADSVVLRHLRELRARMDQRFDDQDERSVKLEGHLADVRGLVMDTRKDVAGLTGRTENVETDVAGIAAVVRDTHADVQAVGRRLDNIETNLRVADRLAELEQQVAELRRRAG